MHVLFLHVIRRNRYFFLYNFYSKNYGIYVLLLLQVKKIDVSNFSNNNLQNMNWMFGQCYEIKELNFSNFNNNHNFLYNLCGIFINCIGLKKLNIYKFNTNNVIDMRSMFNYCRSLKQLNLSNFNTLNVRKMDSMLQSVYL